MAELPADINTQTVTGWFVRTRIDRVPLAGLSISFTPDLDVPVVTHRAATVQIVAVDATTDADGYLCLTSDINPGSGLAPEDARGVSLVMSTDENIDPHHWSWKVRIAGPTFPTQSYSFILGELPVDLAQVVKVPGTPGDEVIAWQETVEAALRAVADAEAVAAGLPAAATDAVATQVTEQVAPLVAEAAGQANSAAASKVQAASSATAAGVARAAAETAAAEATAPTSAMVASEVATPGTPTRTALDGQFAKLPAPAKNALTGWFHVDGFAGSTQDAKILAAVTAAAGVAPVYLPAGTYTLSAAVPLPSATQLIADPDAVVDLGALDYAFSFISQNSLLIDGLKFIGADAKSEAIRLGAAASKITIRNCVTRTVRLVRSNVGTSYANGTTDAVKDILVTGNVCETAAAAAPSVAAIELRYVERAVISDNVISGFRHGIMFWGGNSNPATDGALANARKARDITITGNLVRDVALGGIWGAMGENVAITGNTVRDCGDVGIDVEGSFNVTMTGNTTANCGNGGIAVFYFCRGVVISGNSCSTTVDGQRLIAIYNSGTYTESKDILITGNTLMGVGVIAVLGHDTAEDIVVSNNLMRNVRFQWDSANYRHLVISGNTMMFDVIAAALFAAIVLFKPRDASARQIARGNTVISSVTQPAGSMGIHAYSDSSNNSPTFIIESNTIVNFPTDIKTSQMSSNAGQTAYFHIRNNVLGAGVLERIEGTTLRSNVLFEGNRLANQTPFPSAIPTAGKWDRGQQVIYADPATAGYIGAVCTAGGTPGTWKGFGALQP